MAGEDRIAEFREVAEMMPDDPVDQMVEDLKARRARWGISNYAIHEPYLDPLAPVVERLAGA